LLSGGWGWRKVDVGALPAFLGVKCCCKVENAGRACFLASSLGSSRCLDVVATSSCLDDSEVSDTSGFVRVDAERFNAASRPELLIAPGTVSAEVLLGGFTI